MASKKQTRCAGKNCLVVLGRKNVTGLCRACGNKQRGGLKTAAKPTLTDSLTTNGDAAEVTKFTAERVRTLADLVRVCEIDTTEWEIERWVANKWEMGSVDKKSGQAQSTPLFQVKAYLRRKIALTLARNEIADLIADAKKAIAPRMRIARASLGKHLLEISIPDLHAGKLAWGAETGGANYDTKIAVDRFETALDALLQRTASFTFERVLLVVGNDLVNIDNKANTTTRGTPQSSDGRLFKTFGIVRRMMTRAIDKLRLVAPVTVMVVPGNHDETVSHFLGDSLECYFHSTPDVTVDNAPTTRKYFHFHKVLLMFTHGDKGKRQDYPLLLATERPDLFGRTTHREVHTGHLHQVRLQEHHGVRVRISPALTEADAWHAENGYTGNAMGAEAFVWHPEDGLVTMAFYTVPKSVPVAQEAAA